MSLKRREFLGLTAKSAILIGLGNSLQSFSSHPSGLPAPDELNLRFAIASDGHYGQPDTQYAFLHDEMRDWLIREKGQMGLGFSIINGDLFHDDPVFLPLVKSKWDGLNMPYYVSHGNHDKIDEAGWKKTWNLPWDHSFEREDAAFLILNTSDSDGKYIGPDLEWTRHELSRWASKKQLFVFMHITPFTWTKGGMACPELVELFDRQDNLKAIFHGHDHDQDGARENRGKSYFFDSHIGGNWGTAYQGYRIIEVLKTGEILTYQMNPTEKKQINRNLIMLR
jgi:3',5'-cyclic-AMP phosphodiesterase